MYIPELLAPAGSVETFFAGFKAGADAFYLGANRFSARARAKNFSLDELRYVTGYSHDNGKKVYAAVNTLIYDDEIPEILNLLEFLSDIKIDAVIIQDIGLIPILKENYPEIPIHASTQMFCHNSLCAEFLKTNGISRIVLPRELSLEEIREIKNKVPMDYEIFIHGAMCMSFSGCCLASSYMFGESGNRGECRQVCRFKFEKDGSEFYPFSMKDLNTFKILKKIVKTGVNSLKIEGRLKNSEYVSRTVSAYRKMLDSIRDDTPFNLIDPGSERVSSEGYFSGNGSYSNLILNDVRGTAGKEIGKTVSFGPGTILMELREIPQRGTRLRIQDSNGKNIYEGTLIDFLVASKEKGKVIITWKIKGYTSKGEKDSYTVYSVGMSAPFDYTGALKKLAKKQVNGEAGITVEFGKDFVKIIARIPGSDKIIEKSYAVETEPSIKNAFTSTRCSEIFSQDGDYPFNTISVNCTVADNLFCPVRIVKDIKRSFYSELSNQILELHLTKRNLRIKTILDKLDGIQKELINPGLKSKTAIYYRSESDNSIIDTSDFVIIKAEAALSEKIIIPKPQIIIELPLFLKESNIPEWRNKVSKLFESGYKYFLAANAGWLIILNEFENISIISGPYLYAVNTSGVEFLKNSGASYFILSPDIAEKNFGKLTIFNNRIKPLNPPKQLFVTRLDISQGEYQYAGKILNSHIYEDYSIIEEKEE